MGFHDVAEFVFRVYKMITTVDITVVLYGQGLAAGLAGHTFLRTVAKHHGDGVFKLIDKYTAVVLLEPLIPHAAQKISPVIGVYRPVGDDGFGMTRSCPWCANGRKLVPVPAPGCDGSKINWLQPWRKLNDARTHVVAQKTVDVNGLSCIQAIDYTQCAEWNSELVRTLAIFPLGERVINSNE